MIETLPVAVYFLHSKIKVAGQHRDRMVSRHMVFKVYQGKLTEWSSEDGYLTVHFFFDGNESQIWNYQARQYTPTSKITKHEARGIWHDFVDKGWTPVTTMTVETQEI